jgi:hypothetical protein
MKPAQRILHLFTLVSIGVCFAVVASAQEAAPAVTEENILSLLKAMFFQVLNSPASLLVILGLSIIAVVVEIVEWIPSNPVKVSLPLCVFGGGSTYWLFSSPASVDKAFPHPHAVLVVNGLVCGLAAFLIHVALVKLILSKINPPKPPTP